MGNEFEFDNPIPLNILFWSLVFPRCFFGDRIGRLNASQDEVTEFPTFSVEGMDRPTQAIVGKGERRDFAPRFPAA